MNQKNGYSFENTEYAFAYKTNSALKKAEWLFSAMGYPALVNWGTKLLPWAIKVKLPIKSIIRNTLFEQFVGGESLVATAPVAEKLGRYNVKVILDYGVEGDAYDETALDLAKDEFIRVIKYAAAQPNVPFMSIKMTGLARYSLLEKLDAMMHQSTGTLVKRYEAALAALPVQEQQEWQKVVHRMETIGREATMAKVGVLIDAEETWIQDPIDALVMIMMDRYNKATPVIYNTIQLYRSDRYQFLVDCLEAAQQRNFLLAVKLVRGAYMEKERERAASMGYPSPIQPDKTSCDADFDKSVDLCLSNLNQVAVIIASHNDQSNLKAVYRLQADGRPLDHPHVHFSQLYGMSDHITFNLAKWGCTVSKYLPFGPIEEVIPYLMRRAQENSSVKGQTGRELGLIRQELKRRTKAS